MNRPYTHTTRWLLLTLAILACVFTAVRAAEDEENHNIQSLSDLNGKRLGVLAGTMLDDAANGALDFTQITYFDDNQSEIRALMAGEIDAIVDDEPVVRFLAAANPQLLMLQESLQYDDYGFAFNPENTALHERVNPILRECIDDGTIDGLVEKWVEGTEADRVMPDMPDAPDAGNSPVLRFGVSSVSAPFAYPGADGEVIGLDIELMHLVARRLGMRLEVIDMDFAKLLPTLLADQVDIIGGCLSITEDRKKVILFTDGYYTGGVAVLVRNPEFLRPVRGE